MTIPQYRTNKTIATTTSLQYIKGSNATATAMTCHRGTAQCNKCYTVYRGAQCNNCNTVNRDKDMLIL